MSAAIAPIRLAPLALWRVAETFLLTLAGLFGAPERVAFQHTLTGRSHRLLASWLRAGEALMRRLIAIEAAAYPKPNTRPLLHASKLLGRTRSRKLGGFDAEHPEKWRVSFRCFSSDRPRPTGKPRKARSADERWRRKWLGEAPETFHSAWPLAERYEALLRAFNDPAPYAKRLAARLHATPHRLVETLRAPADAEHRVPRFLAFKRIALSRWRVHRSSG